MQLLPQQHPLHGIMPCTLFSYCFALFPTSSFHYCVCCCLDVPFVQPYISLAAFKCSSICLSLPLSLLLSLSLSLSLSFSLSALVHVLTFLFQHQFLLELPLYTLIFQPRIPFFSNGISHAGLSSRISILSQSTSDGAVTLQLLQQ